MVAVKIAGTFELRVGKDLAVVGLVAGDDGGGAEVVLRGFTGGGAQSFEAGGVSE